MADELCFSSSSTYNLNKSSNFQLITCTILHDLSFICSFIVSYPLYFSYFIFFYRYFIIFISFISPLFIFTVSLLLLITTTTAFCPKLPELELGILQSVLQELKANLHDVNGDEDDRNFEDFEIYKIVFDGELSIAICNEGDEEASPTRKIVEDADTGGRRNDVTTTDSVTDQSSVEKIIESSFHGDRRIDVTVTNSDVDDLEKKKGVEKLFEELASRFEDLTTATESNTDSDKVTGALQKPEPAPARNLDCESDSEAIDSSDDDKFSPNTNRSSSSSNLTGDGSMREKEWRRTLACKLFEERHNSRGGDEGMDSLWEAYENENSKNRKEIMINNKSKMMMMMMNNNGGIRSINDDIDDDDDEEMEMSNGPLCCLQALKLSTGKMNLGMGKPNLVKISRAFKGFGWLHHAKNKHGKKR